MSAPGFRWVFMCSHHIYIRRCWVCRSAFLPALFLSRRKDSVFNYLYFTILVESCQEIFEKSFSILRITDTACPTPHPPLSRSPFPSKGEGLQFSTNSKLSPFRLSLIWESYLHSKYDLERCVYESIKGKIKPHLWGNKWAAQPLEWGVGHTVSVIYTSAFV